MKLDWRKIGLAVVLAAFVFIVLTGFFWTFVRDWIAIPIYFLAWVSDLILKSFPQQLYLALLILVCVIIGLDALWAIKLVPNAESAEQKPAPSRSRYVYWRTLCAYAQASAYSREKFAAESRKLILAVLADQQGVDGAQVQLRVENGSLAVPEAIRKLITQQETTLFEGGSRRNGTRPRWWQLFHKYIPPQQDDQATEIADFVEQLLELNHAERQSDQQG